MGTMLRLFFNLAGNKGTGLGTLRECANKFTCTSWVTLQSLRTSTAGGLEHGAAGPLLFSYWAASFHRPGIRDQRGEGGSMRESGYMRGLAPCVANGGMEGLQHPHAKCPKGR